MSQTAMKRNKEAARKEKQADKKAKAEQRLKEKKDRPAGEDGVDPDIAGIVPGPQPREDEDDY
ncbi:MAG: hypothetical protein NVS3B20_07950 [Polyangiales bacterium]